MCSLTLEGSLYINVLKGESASVLIFLNLCVNMSRFLQHHNWFGSQSRSKSDEETSTSVRKHCDWTLQ